MATIYHQFLPEDAQFLGTAFPQITKTNGSGSPAIPVSGLAYDADADEIAHWKFIARAYGTGNLTLNIYWYAAATTNAVVWSTSIAANRVAAAQSLLTDSYSTAQTATPTVGSTTNQLNITSITISNLDSLANGDYVMLQIQRTGSSGSDTMTGDAILVMAELSYSDT